jgi:pimeloyl-ACP methyl ester carboxylesterase
MSEELEHLGLAADLAGIRLPELVAPSHHQVIANGVRLHYVDWGTRGRPPVVFAHGGSLTARTWDLVCLALRLDFHCIAFDMRGHGDSEWPADADYRLETMAADIDGFADAIELGRFTLVGHSFGGISSIEYAAGADGRLRGLVLVDTCPDLHIAAGERIRSLPDATGELATLDEYVSRIRALRPDRDERLIRRNLGHNLRRMPSGRWAWKWDARRMGETDLETLAARFEGLWEQLARIRCPTLVVRGERSDVLLPEDVIKMVSVLRDGAGAEIEGARHTVQGSNPAGLVDVLRPFLERVTG